MMIWLHNPETGQVQAVASLAGIDLEVWTEITAEAAAVLAPPPERRLTKSEFLDLWTLEETVAVMETADSTLKWLWARTLAWDGIFLMSDPRVLAGIDRAEQIGILTAESATRKRAGLLPVPPP